MFERKKNVSLFLIALLFMMVTVTESTVIAGTHSLSPSAESAVVGGGCSSFADGIAVGMGVAALFGCVWCVLGSAAAKTFAFYACD